MFSHDAYPGLLWSGREDFTLRLHRPERCALPVCATPRQFTFKNAHLRRQNGKFKTQRTKSTPRLKFTVLPCIWTFLNVNSACHPELVSGSISVLPILIERGFIVNRVARGGGRKYWLLLRRLLCLLRRLLPLQAPGPRLRPCSIQGLPV